MSFARTTLFLCIFLLLSNFFSTAQISVSWTYSVSKTQVNFNITTVGNPASNYQWNFGGSVTSSSSYLAHYSTPGTYYACLTVTDSLSNTASYCDSIYVPCYADFLTSKSLLQANFTNKSYTANGAYTWDFGDGSSTSNTTSPSHTYSTPGTYYVCLNTVDTNMCFDSYCDSITVDSVNVISASFTYNVNNRYVNFYPTVVGLGIVSTTWNVPAQQLGPNYFKFGNPGTYQACLTITDSLSNTYTYCDSVILPCTSDFDYTKNKFQVNFNNKAFNRFTGYHYWDFGDGSPTSSVLNPSHTYTQAGMYNVCLYVADSTLNCSQAFCDSVTIDSVNNLTASFTHSVSKGVVTFSPTITGGVKLTENWNYGGSSYLVGQNTVKYASNGTYYVCYTVVDTLFNTFTYCDSVYVPCAADFSYSTNMLQVFFSNKSTTYGNNYSWNFGDGSATSSYMNPSHTYTSSGMYNVCLTVTDTSCSDTFCDSIPVNIGNPPTVSYTYIINGRNVSFYVQLSSNASQFTNFNWNYGGATTQINTNEVKYNSPGYYYVCLTASDSLSNTISFCDSIYIACIADFVNINNQLQVQFFNNSFVSNGTYSWNFGDGSAGSSVKSPSHTYTSPGNYVVCLTATDSTINCTDVYCDTISVDTNSNISVSFTYTTNGPWVNYILTSNATNITSQTWSFPGAIQTNGSFAKYAQPGKYYTCVMIQDTFLSTASFCDSVVLPCSSKFTSTKSLLTVTYKNKSFISGSNYSWDFGDGTSSLLKSPSHSYLAAGTYNVCLTVVDSLTNCTSTYCDSITVISSYQCNANFSYSIPSPGLVNFVDNSTHNYSFVGHYWDFGNGTTFQASGSFNYQYNIDGKYNVCLTITDSLNLCTSTYCDSITIVNAPPPPPYYYYLGGTFIYDSNTTNYPRVYLIKATFDTVVSSTYLTAVDSSDSQWFNFHVKEGTYYLKASLKPGSFHYGSKLPTYYNQELLWSNATPIVLNQNKNVTLTQISGVNPGGPGFISGYVSLGANLIPGDPIPNLDILLFDEADNPIAHTKSDQDGKYSFGNLALGTYKIYCDLLNIPAAPIYVTLDQSNTNSTGNNLEVNSTGVGAPVGLSTPTKIKESHWSIFPNPSNGNLKVQIESHIYDAASIEVRSITGKLIQYQKASINIGRNEIALNLSDQPSGIYFIKINSSTIDTVEKVIKQ